MQAAWERFSSAGAVQDIFAGFRGPAFVALAEALAISRSFLTALRDRLVFPTHDPASISR